MDSDNTSKNFKYQSIIKPGQMQLEVVATYLVYHLFYLCSTLMNKYSLFSLWMESCYSLSCKVLNFFLLFAMRVVIKQGNESFSFKWFCY